MNEARQTVTESAEETFAFGEELGGILSGGEIVLLTGGLGAGKTLLTKGIMQAVGYDVDEVTSPSFTLVNLYRTPRFEVYHIDLWRSELGTAAFSVGLDEILEDETNVVIIEWAERLAELDLPGRSAIHVAIDGDGDEPRRIRVRAVDQMPVSGV
jgi:tRNA threonylcarbamoyladenosine biosynthesis protein TsaE